jgi:CHAT domain-containing protein/Tfp pilus assembly protein PilF
MEQALAMLRKLYPQSRFPDGHPLLVAMYNDLGLVFASQGDLTRAVEYLEKYVAQCQKLYPRSTYPAGHRELATGLMNLGTLLMQQSKYDAALGRMEEALAMWKELYPASQYPDGHANLAIGLNNLGLVLKMQGALEKALPYYEQSLAMFRKLFPESKYPQGHPYLVGSLSNLGRLQQTLGAHDKARDRCRQALEMSEKLYPASRYPRGHPDVANQHFTLGVILLKQANDREAATHHQEALRIRQQLYTAERYPNGHPDLALSLNDLGVLASRQNQFEEALKYHEQALEMRRKLFPASKYPDGHADVADSLFNVGLIYLDLNRFREARTFFAEELAMRRRLTAREIALASEAEALAFVGTRPFSRDCYLTVTAQQPDLDAEVYRAIWDSKALLTRVLERRSTAARVAGSAQAASLKRLSDLRRVSERLLQDPRIKPADRDRQLAALADERERLERELARALPVLKQWQERDALGPDDLLKRLPPKTAFVDFTRSVPVAPKAKSVHPGDDAYVAFVLVPGRPIRRVELGPVERIIPLIQEWRQAIDARRESTAAAELRKRVWEPIAAHLPADTTTVYLSPDGDLARLPFAALPGPTPGSVLLEKHLFAVVPHGPFLLQQLAFPRPLDPAPDRCLVLGGVNYGSASASAAKYPALSGTDEERKQILALAADRGISLTGSAADTKRLKELLPAVRFAHLATHGYYDARQLAAELQRQDEELNRWRKSDEPGKERAGLAARNPLLFTGLVLADANQPTAENPGILTAERIVELSLERLQLCVLSACETGLGADVRGEGIQGLQRAFHLAGCPNVVASLWKVNDAATTALMAQFYHELWVNKKTPLEALREAQLTVYRHPERIPALAGSRGRPALEEAAKLGSAPPTKPEEKPKTTPTKLWAAFVLSGVGNY